MHGLLVEMAGRMEAGASRYALKAHWSRTTGEGEEHELLRNTERELGAAKAELEGMIRERNELSREISVRERKLCDWKGKVPRGELEPPTRALERASDVSCVCIGVVRGRRMEIEKRYRRALTGLSGFSHGWVIYLKGGGDEVIVEGVKLERIDEKSGILELSEGLKQAQAETGLEAKIVDLKPYLGYCDSHPLTRDVT